MAKKEEPKKAAKDKKGADRPSKIVRLAKPTTVLNRKAPQPQAKETNLIRRVTMKSPDVEIQDFRSGDTVNVFVRVKEGEKERVQLYKGVVTKIQGAGVAKSFTVRKISAGIGVERTFPFVSPALEKVEVVNHGKVRKSRLFYLREREGKAAKIDSELVAQVSASDAAASAAAGSKAE